MKKLLTLLVVFASTYSFSQTWNFIGSSTGIANATEVDIEITPGGNLYAAALSAGTVTVYKWSSFSASWVSMSGSNVPGTTSGLDLLVIGETTPVFAVKSKQSAAIQDQYLYIYKFNGTSWVYQNFPGGYNMLNYNHDYSLKVNSSNQLILTFFNESEQATGFSPEDALITGNLSTGAVFGGASPNLDQNNFNGRLASHVDGNTAYIMHQEADMSDYIPYDISVNGAAYLNNTIDNFDGASKMLMDKNNGATAVSSVWAVPYSSFDLRYRSWNGTTFGTQTVISTGTNVVDFDFDTENNDSYVFYKTTSCFFSKITGIAAPGVSNISNGATLAPSTATCLRTEIYNGVYVIAYVNGGKFYVKEYNQAANIEDWDTFVMCEGTTFNNGASNSIYLLDPNFSQANISMTVTSQNVAIIPNSAVSVFGSGLNYSVVVTNTNDVTSPTTVDLEFKLFENGSLVGTQLIQMLVNPKPVITFTNPVNAACKNANPINLTNWATPIGGTWSGTGITNNTFYPSYPTGSSVVMNYSKTNQYGCTASNPLPFTINQTPVLNVTTNSSNCNQNTGTAAVTITNGQSPYSIYWSTGSTQSSVSDLAPGQYLVSVTDANGCLSTSTSMVGSNGLSQTGVPSGAACYGTNNGAINVTVTGGAAPLVYAWSNGATTEDVTGLAGGPYELTITDAIGCVSTATYTVLEPQQMMLNQMTVTQPACSSTNGQVVASFNGGTSPFTYVWVNSQGDTIGTNSATLTNIGAGTYACNITDANGCTFSSVALVSNNFGPTLAIDTIIPASCSNDGQIQLTVISGSATAYLWTNGATTQDISNLSPGTYSVSVTGSSGCITVLGGTVESTLPDAIEICLVTVDSVTNTNLVVWEKPITTGIDHFNIYRETSQAGLFQLVGSVPYTDESIYNDVVASPNVRSWRYKISSVDDCGNESELSLVHKTIHLVISHGLGNDINLFWDSYEGFNYPNFLVRKHTNAAGWTTIQTMPNNLFTFTDQALDTDGLFYEVTVDAPSLCSTTKMAQDFNTTRSNRDNRLSTGQPNSVSEFLNQVVNIYPNPANSFLNIDNSSSQLIEARILDQTGRVISSTTLVPGQTKIDCGKLAMGVYNIELQSQGAKTLKRFVIEK